MPRLVMPHHTISRHDPLGTGASTALAEMECDGGGWGRPARQAVAATILANLRRRWASATHQNGAGSFVATPGAADGCATYTLEVGVLQVQSKHALRNQLLIHKGQGCGCGCRTPAVFRFVCDASVGSLGEGDAHLAQCLPRRRGNRRII